MTSSLLPGGFCLAGYKYFDYVNYEKPFWLVFIVKLNRTLLLCACSCTSFIHMGTWAFTICCSLFRFLSLLKSLCLAGEGVVSAYEHYVVVALDFKVLFPSIPPQHFNAFFISVGGVPSGSILCTCAFFFRVARGL